MLNSSIFRSALKNGLQSTRSFSLDIFKPLRQWLNQLVIHNPAQARLICQIIPAQCPFEREICLGNRLSIKIPPLCKLNPLYEEVVGLRFRALTCLAEECPNEVRHYC